MARTKNLKKLSSTTKSVKEKIDAGSSQIDQTHAVVHNEKDSYALKSTVKKITKSKIDSSQEEGSGQTIASVKVSQQNDKIYDVTNLHTNLFKTDSLISSSASDNANSNDWRKYFWVGAGTVGVVGAAVALADSGGGGGSPAPSITDINNFQEFCASERFLSPTTLNLTADGSYDYLLDQGFERSDLGTVNFNTLDYAALAGLNVAASGLSINVDTEEAYVDVTVQAEAEDDSELIWMENVSITSTEDNTSYAVGGVSVVASAFSGSVDALADAEVGICDLSVNINSNQGYAFAEIAAYASDLAQANVIINEVNLETIASGSGSEGEDSFSYSVLGGIEADASFDATADVEIGNISVTTEMTGDDAWALAGFAGNYSGSSNYASIVSEAEDTASASVVVNGNIDVNTLTSGDNSQSIASLSLTPQYGNVAFVNAGISAYAIDSEANANISVMGDINIEAEALGDNSLAEATFAQQISLLGGEGYGNVDVFAAGITAKIGEDNWDNVDNSSASVNLANINILAEAVEEDGDAAALFVKGEDANNVELDISATNSYLGYSNNINDSDVSVEIGNISLIATASSSAYAGMVFSPGNYAASASLNIEAKAIAENAGDNNTYSVNLGNLNIEATSEGIGGDAYAFLTARADEQNIEIRSFQQFDGENNATSVNIEGISISAESEGRNSTATAFGAGEIYLEGDFGEYGEDYFNANIEMSATTYGWENSTSSLTIGNIDIEATTLARNSDAKAFITGDLTALNASLEADFDIAANGEDEGTATTDIGNISVTASVNAIDSTAYAFVAGDVEVDGLSVLGATDSDTQTFNETISAHAHFSVSAEADDDAQAHVTIDNISITANAQTTNSDAIAYMVGMVDAYGSSTVTENASSSTTYATASATAVASSDMNVYAHAQLDIDNEADERAISTINIGDISIEANANSGNLAFQDATAFMVGDLEARSYSYAYATATASVTEANGEDSYNAIATATAEASAYASAFVELSITADASDNAIAETLLGNISIEARSGINGDALAYMAGYAYAYADAWETETATASVLAGSGTPTENETNITPTETTHSEIDVLIQAEGDDNGSSTVSIGSINVSAIGGSGEGSANAFMAGFGEDAHVTIESSGEDYSDATLNIGDITISAIKPSGQGDVSAFIVGEAVNPGNGYGGWARLDINAFGEDSGTATTNLGNIAVEAEGDLGDAYAALTFMGELGDYSSNHIYASATSYASNDYSDYAASANLNINKITVSATTANGTAYAALNHGDGSSTINSYAGANAYDNVANASLSIADGIEVLADGSRNAYAALNLNTSNGDSSDSSAYVSAYARVGGHAITSVDQITITAISEEGDAQAKTHLGGIDNTESYLRAVAIGQGYNGDFYYTNYDTSAHLDILNGITVTADAQTDAIAGIDEVSAYAYWGSEAHLDIGNISVSASGEGNTSANIDTIEAFASEYSTATVNVGHISITSGANNANNALVNLDVYANGEDGSNASVTLGNIDLHAEADLTNGDAQAWLQLYTTTDDYYSDQNSNASIVALDINMSAIGGTGDDTFIYASLYAAMGDSGASSTITVGDIALTSDVTNLENGEDTVKLYINAENSDYATINTGDISIDVLGNAGDAYVDIGDYWNAYDQINIGNLDVYLESANSIADINIDGVSATYDRSATFSGAGDVFLDLDSYRAYGGEMAFDKIYLTDVNYTYTTLAGNVSVDVDANHTGSFHFNWGTGYDDETTLTGDLTFEYEGGQQDLVPHTTIYGYDTGSFSSISFNGVDANSTEFYDITDGTPETSAQSLWASIGDRLDLITNGPGDGGADFSLDHVYVYNVVDETEAGDINGDGYESTHLGVLAYARDSNENDAVSAIVFLNDINSNITADAISSIA